MEYYYLKNRFRYGPVKFEDLKSKDIKKDTLVWYEGLKDWTKASETKELKELFKVKPPPIQPPPIPTPPPAPKKEFKTSSPPSLPKKKVIIEEVKEEIKEPSTLPPSIVKKEKTLSPPTIKTSPTKKIKKSEYTEIPPKKRTKGGQIVTYIIYVWSLFFLGSTIIISFSPLGTNSETKMFNGVLIFFVGLVIWSISYLILRLIRRSFGFITTEN